MISLVIQEMIDCFGKDVRRINHALKVYAFAQQIGRTETLPQEMQQTLEFAAVLHDIGIPEAVRKYGSSTGHYQEIEGPPVAEAILRRLATDEKTIERVLYLVGHHHSYAKIDGIDFQILVEADFLVNIYEDNMDADSIASVADKYFKTASGTALVKSMY